jgi:anti-sigma-K factor RskA
MSISVDVHSLAGAYALNALSPAEREFFTQHMLVCEVCAAEVAEFSETAARLADDAAQTPPPQLRERVLTQISQTSQGSPVVRPITRRVPAPRSTRTLIAAGVAAVVAAAGVYAVQELRLRDQRISHNAEIRRVETVLSAPDAVLRTGSVQGGGQLSIVMSPFLDEAVVVLKDAKEPGFNRVYQFWLIEGANPKPAGALSRDQINATRLLTGVKGMNMLALTTEQAGGSLTPSQPILAQIPMT